MRETEGLYTIRTAYRYVAAYQRRIMDAIATLDDAIADLGFEFKHWGPSRDRGDIRKRPPGDLWSWDALPAFFTDVTWCQGKDDNVAGSAWCWLEHVADTALEVPLAGKREPDPLGSIPQGQSLIRMQWVKALTAFSSMQWKAEWPEIVCATFKCDLDKIWPQKPGSGPVEVKAPGAIAGGLCIDVESLREPADFRRLVVEPTVKALKALSAQG